MANVPPVRVLIADDHQLFAESLGLTLDLDDRLELVGTAKNGKEAVRLAEELRPEVVLINAYRDARPRRDRRNARDSRRQRRMPGRRSDRVARGRGRSSGPNRGGRRLLTKGCFMRDVIDALLEVVQPNRSGKRRKRLTRADRGRPGRRGACGPSCNRTRFPHTECEAVSTHQVAQPCVPHPQSPSLPRPSRPRRRVCSTSGIRARSSATAAAGCLSHARRPRTRFSTPS